MSVVEALEDIDKDGYINGTKVYKVWDIKPYLRPMSSMTEEEKEYIKNRWCYNDWDIDGPSSLWREKIDVEDAEGIIDYFNELIKINPAYFPAWSLYPSTKIPVFYRRFRHIIHYECLKNITAKKEYAPDIEQPPF